MFNPCDRSWGVGYDIMKGIFYFFYNKINCGKPNCPDNICFPNNVLVLIEDNKVEKISQLQIGQKIACSTNNTDIYESVLTFLHYDPDAEADFIELVIGNGELIALSDKHMIFLKDKDGSAKFIPAENA